MEAAGISTVIIAARVFRDQLAKMTLPRVVYLADYSGQPVVKAIAVDKLAYDVGQFIILLSQNFLRVFL